MKEINHVLFRENLFFFFSVMMIKFILIQIKQIYTSQNLDKFQQLSEILLSIGIIEIGLQTLFQIICKYDVAGECTRYFI